MLLSFPLLPFVALAAANAQPPLPPAAMPDAIAVPQCGEVSVDVLANDADPGGHPLQVVNVSGASLGTATIEGGRMIRYKARERTGTDSIMVTVMNGPGATAVSPLIVTIQAGDGCS